MKLLKRADGKMIGFDKTLSQRTKDANARFIIIGTMHINIQEITGNLLKIVTIVYLTWWATCLVSRCEEPSGPCNSACHAQCP